MKILHIVKHCRNANGNVNVAIDLSCAQVTAGHDVVFASEGGILQPLLERNGVRILPIRQDGGKLAMARDLARLVVFCRRFRPDVIHAHMVSSALFGFVAARLCGARLVTTVHNSFDKQSALMRIGDAVVAVSQAEKDLLIRRGFDPRRLTCILNGPIGSVRETLADEERAFPTPCVAMVGGLHRRKGMSDMIEAFAELTDDYPAWHLNIVGEGPDRGELTRIIAERGLARVHLVGAVSHPKPYLERAAIFATCSYAEPFGLSTLEARAAGCAVIGSRVGGTPEVLAFGDAGLLFEAGNRGALRGHLRRLMGDERELALARQRAKSGALYFETARMVQDHTSLYEALIARTRPARLPHSEMPRLVDATVPR